MSYKATDTLAHMITETADEDDIEYQLAARIAYEIFDRVRKYTPVAVRPPKVSAATFRAERHRRPGTLKDSWDIGHARRVAGRLVVEVFTDDPIAPHVEFDTQPHRIKARAGKYLRFRSSKTGQVVYAREVLHPGTTGVHMMGRACAEVSADADRIMASVLRGRWGLPAGSRRRVPRPPGAPEIQPP